MSGRHSVEKVGGTSMSATSTLFDNVLIAGRSGPDLYNRIFVVSAYAGMTDLLLEHKKSGEPGVYARFARNEESWRDALERVRLHAMNMFLEDYPQGRADGRYADAALPSLPFADGAFDLALCSHLLFLYSAQLDEAFHREAVAELCRVAGEVRVFPLLALGGARSPHLQPVCSACRAAGHEVSIERVPYEFQRGADEMLRVRTNRAAR